MGQMQPTRGRHVIRRLEEPWGLPTARWIPTPLAGILADAHNAAVWQYGSDCGGFHAFDPESRSSAGVWDGRGGFPSGTVVTKLAWGRIDAETAQRVLQSEGVYASETTKE